MKRLVRIGAVSKRLGVSVPTLRRWETEASRKRLDEVKQAVEAAQA